MTGFFDKVDAKAMSALFAIQTHKKMQDKGKDTIGKKEHVLFTPPEHSRSSFVSLMRFMFLVF